MRLETLSEKRFVRGARPIQSFFRGLLDFALPPRCAGCGVVVDELHVFCASCWKAIEFLGSGGCDRCGMPLEATDIEACAACLARPPRLNRIRSAVAYDQVTRNLVLRLKYGRKVGIAKTMARYMAPLVAHLPEDAILVPVPLHRSRTWQRGFNQSAIIAKELSTHVRRPFDNELLCRIKRTPPLKGMSRLQRRRAVANAFRVNMATAVRGRTIVLVDDVLTTGSTANACARALQRAGAARVEFVSWARVIRPTQFDQ